MLRSSVRTRNDIYDSRHRQVATEVVKMATKANRNALDMESREYFYFRRMYSGRRCSCVSLEQSEPSGSCRICYATGIVGGYIKHGTEQEVIDVTRFSVLVDCEPDYATDIRPVLIKPTDKSGYLISTVYVPLAKSIDVFNVYGKGCTAYVSAHGVNAWIEATPYHIELLAKTNTKLDFKVVIGNYFSHLILRWKIRSPVIKLDVPVSTRSWQSSELGNEDAFTTQRAFADDTIKHIKQNDIFYCLSNKTYWMAFSVEQKRSMNILTNTDLDMMYIQPYDVYAKIESGEK